MEEVNLSLREMMAAIREVERCECGGMGEGKQKNQKMIFLPKLFFFFLRLVHSEHNTSFG